MITSYYIDKDDVLHTFIGDTKHVSISNVLSDAEAEEIIDELNAEMENIDV